MDNARGLDGGEIASRLRQDRLAVALKFSVIVGAVVAFYLQDLSLVFSNAVSDESTYHILAVPFIFGYLLYRKRSMVKASLVEPSSGSRFLEKNFTALVGVVLCTIAVLTYWFGSYAFTPLEYHMMTLPVFVVGLVLLLFGRQMLRQLAFPLAFLVFLTPPPNEFLYSVGSTLADLSAHASNGLANLFGLSSTISAQYGSPIITLTKPDLTVMSFSVDVACSGVYSLIGFGIFAVFIAYITKGQLWKKAIILALGIPLIISLNIVRITAMLGIANSFGAQIALDAFHAVGATVLMFIGTLILLGISEKVIKKPPSLPPCSTCAANSDASEFCPCCGILRKYPKVRLTRYDVAKVAAVAFAITVLLSIQAPVFALTEGPAEILVQTPSGLQPNVEILPLPQIQGYNLSYVYRDSSFEKLSGQDASLVYAYGSTSPSRPTVWVSLELASSTGPLHRWETCLINYPLSRGAQPRVTQLDLTDVQTQANPPIVGRYFAFQYRSTNQTQVVLYWYETATFQLNGTSQQKHVKMSLVTYPRSPQDVEQAEALLLPIAQDINNYWQPIKTWTTVALAISQSGLALSGTATTMLIALLVYMLFLGRQERASLMRLYGKLPEQTQLLAKAVGNAQIEGNPTEENILGELEKLKAMPGLKEDTGSLLLNDPHELRTKLLEMEHMGLVKRVLSSHDDQPVVQWRSQLLSSYLHKVRKFVL